MKVIRMISMLTTLSFFIVATYIQPRQPARLGPFLLVTLASETKNEFRGISSSLGLLYMLYRYSTKPLYNFKMKYVKIIHYNKVP